MTPSEARRTFIGGGHARLARWSFTFFGLLVGLALSAVARAQGPEALLPPPLPQAPTFGGPAVLNAGADRDGHGDEAPRLAGGGGVWVVVWQVSGAASLGLGRDIDIVYSRSVDQGASWSAPKPLAEKFTRDRAEDRQPALATDGKGVWVAVWTSTDDLVGQVKRDRDIHVSVSTDGALTWSPPRALNSNAAKDWGDDESPSIAVDGTGRWVVVWQSSDSLGNTKGGDRDILFASSPDAALTWTPPAVVDAGAKTDSLFDTTPRVAADAGGVWVVAWATGGISEDRSGYQRDVLLARTGDGGKTWSAPRSLAGARGDDKPEWGPRVAADGRGNWLCAWASGDPMGDTIGHDRDILFVRSSDGGLTWTERAPLNVEAGEDSGDDGSPELVTDGEGNWVAAWTSWEKRVGASGPSGADADIFVALSRDAGKTWSRSRHLNTNAPTDRGEDLDPTLATDGKGLWMSAWSSNETTGDVLGSDRDLLVAVGYFGNDVPGPPLNP